MGQGSREHDLLGRVDNNFGNLILCYSREGGKGGGESGVICCELREVENT